MDKSFCPFLPGDAKRNQKNLWLAERAPAMPALERRPADKVFLFDTSWAPKWCWGVHVAYYSEY